VRAEGYAATIVNGTVVTEQGELTSARPGRVLREFSRA
jgi:N-acyl-D-aspartate/D-glutamate deacylase